MCFPKLDQFDCGVEMPLPPPLACIPEEGSSLIFNSCDRVFPFCAAFELIDWGVLFAFPDYVHAVFLLLICA
jgi:hypothetical protein